MATNETGQELYLKNNPNTGFIADPLSQFEPECRARWNARKLEIQQVYFASRNSQPERAQDIWDIANQAMIDLKEIKPEMWIGKRPSPEA